jgi:class 3 adenylate cyclase/predicted ATPase
VTVCSSCGAENPPGKRFCGDCGSPLDAGCPACGAVNPPGKRFCGDCGTPLTEAVSASVAPAVVPATPEVVSERRLVSVLFADLVGFTPLSESRDAEEVRALLSRYFDTCRRLIELYGGSVEKFIGDAVMAVWGTPTATEDDAERAVRAALDLVAAVSALGQEVGAEQLRVRAGVLTGEAAVTVGATGEGMVAGDVVNTASRVQSVADPGTVFVGEATRRATEQAIVYEDAGAFELKGKEGETRLWKALRVVSGVGGDLKSQGLEAPFVGRDRELRQFKDLFHICADEKRAHLVSVTGIAGIGKSRLGWEFYKYFDGIASTIYWHRGRCLAYGEGVTYWALADMVRMRCRIAEDEQPAAVVEKLRAALEEHILDAEERRFIEPRLAQLLGVGQDDSREQQDLFAAWRLFFERLSDVYPTILAFEDMQWADASLLDFVEYLLEWSRNHPLFVVTLARPELAERRPTWGAGHRNATSLYLEPLTEGAMEELLDGLVPGLPAAVREQILARAEGVPLYAVETVRMLLDRGLIAEDGAAYRVVGEVASLEVPETLHALIAARLDGLSAEERRLLGDASVLGKTFTPDALASLSGVSVDDLEPMLKALARREVLGVQSDPRSPEQGQYGFLQDLLRQVAYDTLPKRERRAKHLAAAEYLSTSPLDEVAEVIASHLLDAYRLDADAPDAEALRAKAHAALVRAGERAASLGAVGEARRYFEQAIELAADPEQEAAAVFQAGDMALRTGDNDGAMALFVRAAELYGSTGDTHAALRATAWSGTAQLRAGHAEEAMERLERVYEPVAGEEPDADLVLAATRLASIKMFVGDLEAATVLNARALDMAEALGLTGELVRAWGQRATLVAGHRPREARGMFELALDTARALDVPDTSFLLANISDLCLQRDRYVESLAYLEENRSVTQRRGDRGNEWFTLSELTYALFMLGRWDEAIARLGEIPDEQIGASANLLSLLSGALEIFVNRGDLDRARELLSQYEHFGEVADLQARGGFHAGASSVRLAEGNARDALAAAELAFANRAAFGIASQEVETGFVRGVEAALALGDAAKVREMLAIVEAEPVGLLPPLLAASADRFRARLAGDDAGADGLFAAAEGRFREVGLPFHLAVVLVEHSEWLFAQGRSVDAEPLVEEAGETVARLGATPWLERIERLATDERRQVTA